jgi:hypothetical protein
VLLLCEHSVTPPLSQCLSLCHPSSIIIVVTIMVCRGMNFENMPELSVDRYAWFPGVRLLW